VVDISKRISDVPEWFKGSRMNYAENLLKHKDQDKVALYAASKYGWGNSVHLLGFFPSIFIGQFPRSHSSAVE
jgi:hypothetical protein